MTSIIGEHYRKPRCRVIVGGSTLINCQSIELSTTNFAQANSFFAELAVGRHSGLSPDQLFPDAATEISIQMGFLPPGSASAGLVWTELMSGRVDRIRFDPIAGSIVLEGRDHAARLLDLPVSEGFLNCTSSDVARQLGDRCGLKPIVDTTTTMVGQYYQIQHSRSVFTQHSRFRTGWELLASLAQIERFDLWTQGDELHFQMANSDPTIYEIDVSSLLSGGGGSGLHISKLIMDRSNSIAAGIGVAVSSWNSRQRLRVQASSGQVTASSPTINVIRPNLLADTAQSLASGILSQVAGHGRTISITMAGELSVRPRQRIRLRGSDGGWDGEYRIESVDREMTLAGGFSQHVSAKSVVIPE